MAEMKFEEAMGRLEEIVKRLEDTEVPLDDAIKLYEEGQKLLKSLRDKLGRAEAKIKELTKTEEGFSLKETKKLDDL